MMEVISYARFILNWFDIRQRAVMLWNLDSLISLHSNKTFCSHESDVKEVTFHGSRFGHLHCRAPAASLETPGAAHSPRSHHRRHHTLPF